MENVAAIVAAVIGAVAVAGAAWISSLPRGLRRLREEVEILAALPADSDERDAFRAHVDASLRDTIDKRKVAGVAKYVTVLYVYGVGALISWQVSRSSGAAWLFLSVLLGVLFVGLSVAGVWLVVRASRRAPSSPPRD